jgi:cation transport ATPase
MRICRSFSNHSYAASILRAYGREIDNTVIEKHQKYQDIGIKICLQGKEILVGTKNSLGKKKYIN